MKDPMINRLIIITLLHITCFIQGYPNKAIHLAHGKSNVYLVHDFHWTSSIKSPYLTVELGQQLRDDLIDTIKRVNGLLIVEDNLVGSQEGMAALFRDPVNFDISQYPQPSTTLEKLHKSEADLPSCPINGLSGFAHQAKIPYRNIEFRFAQRWSINGFIKANLMLASIEKIARQIEAYDDNEILNAYYKNEALAPYNMAYTQAKPFFDALRNSRSDVKQALSKIDYRDSYNSIIDHVYKKKISDLLNTEDKKLYLVSYFTSSLLNAQILHTISEQAKNHNHIFVVAGGVHIKDIYPWLIQLGYQEIKTAGLDYQCDKDGRTIHPKPVFLSDLFKVQVAM